MGERNGQTVGILIFSQLIVSVTSDRSIDEMDARPSFASYVNRGKNIFS